jgi:predicted porin
MVLPCRIHWARDRVDRLPVTCLVIAFLMAVQSGPISAQATVPTLDRTGVIWLPAIPMQITAGVDAGYDDNPTLTPNSQGSRFTRESIVLTYDRPGKRTQLYLVGVGRFRQYLDVTGQDETSGNITFGLAHNFSSRLSCYVSLYGAYQNEPNFRSDIGPENVRAAFFETDDILSVSYHWLPRLALVTTYTLRRVKYDNQSIGSFQDRVEQTIGERLQFSLTSRTNLSADYRFEGINYDTAATDSTTHYLLAGIDHHLTEHLVVRLNGGESFRSLENAGTVACPYFESSVDYIASNHSVGWLTSYSLEAPNQQDVSIRKTWRTGLNLTYSLTSRLLSMAAVYYHHDQNQGGISSGPQDALDMTLGLRYVIKKGFILQVDYSHSSETALGSMPAYSRNSYSAGLSYTY